MLTDNRLLKILINNIAIGLGLSFLIIGLFLLMNPRLDTDKSVDLIRQINSEGLELNYNSLSTEASTEEIELIIPAGSSGFTVANLLEEADLISAEEFRKYIYLLNIEKRLRAGTYRFNNQESIADILTKILIN